MSDRRRLLLMAALNNGVWLPYSYEYLYHDLIPTDINGGEVKNKARVSKVYANGVIENQLIANKATSGTPNNLTVVVNNENIKVSGTANALTQIYMCANGYSNQINLISGHKYLVCGLWNVNGSSSTYDIRVGNHTIYNSQIITETTNQTADVYLVIRSGVSVDFEIAPQVIDLTQMFPFDTPTTLTDNRVQELLNRGYIPYNTGTYKGTDIGVVSSEPYNLLSLDRTAGTLNGSSNSHGNKQDFSDTKYYAGLSTTDYVHQTVVSYVNISGSTISFLTNNSAYGVGIPIKVIGGKSYTLEIGGSTNSGDVYISFYDENGMFISSSIANSSVTAPNNAYWGVIILIANTSGSQTSYTDICLHRTGTRTGYAPYQAFTPITFKYQGNGAGTSHDTYEITKTEHVFTKNMNGYTFNGSETFSIGGQITTGLYRYYTSDLSSLMSSGSGQDGLCDKYPTDTGYYNAATTPCIRFGQSNKAIYFYLTQNYSTSSEVASFINGANVIYPLETPQVIRIPRKHLGIVDLGSLEWVKVGINLFKAIIPNAKGTSANNIYISNYMLNTSGWDSEANLQDKQYSYKQWTTNHDLLIKDSRCELANDFISVIQGTYAWFETDTEVADINNIVDIESGGTVNTNWFGWVENQLVVNGNFSNGTTSWSSTGSVASFSASDNVLTFQASAQYGGVRQDFSITAGNKYLFIASIKQGSLSNEVHAILTNMSSADLYGGTNTNWNKLVTIATANANQTSSSLRIRDYGQSGWVDNYVKNVLICDLTLMFGAGNEPTSINDPRIQYIINQGYIPTDTTGTYKLVNCEVLPNVDVDIKCNKPQQTGAIGTWVFNNTIDITDMLDKTIDIDFTCNNVSYTSMQFFSEYDDDMWLYYGYYGNTMVYGSTMTTGSLLNANYKTIIITGGTDATTPSFIAWLEANATKQ